MDINSWNKRMSQFFTKVPLTLQEMCMERTVVLLKEGYYEQDSGSKTSFAFIPPVIADELFRAVLYAKKDARRTKADMLRPLLKSARITSLHLNQIVLDDKNSIEIMDSIRDVSNLRRLHVIRDPIDGQWTRSNDKIRLRDDFNCAVKNFITKCSNLEYLTIPGEVFDAAVLTRHPKLEKLDVFDLKRPTLLESQIDASFIHHNLREFKINESEDFQATIAKLLECCPNLASVENDIAGALEILHGQQLSEGGLSKRYNLRKYELTIREPGTALSIATTTCPLTAELKLHLLVITDLDCLASLAKLENLSVTVFSINDDKSVNDLVFDWKFGDALQHIGASIKKMSIFFAKVDFEVIGRCCPNLTSLEAIYLHSHDIPDPSAEYFLKLRDLVFKCYVKWPHVQRDLQFVLSSCRELRTLHLKCGKCFTDELLKKLLRKNNFLFLKGIKLEECSLTEEGIHLLLESCPSLVDIDISSLLLPRAGHVAEIIRNFNPNGRRFHQ